MASNDEYIFELRSAIEHNEIAKISTMIASGVVKLNDKPWPLHCAAARGRVEIMTMLLDAGASIDAVDENHKTAYLVAIRNNQFAALKRLVERDPNIAVPRQLGFSLLDAVVEVRDDRMAVLLLDAGAPLDHFTHETFIYLLASSQSVAVLTRLLARNVDMRTFRDWNDCSVCHHVVLNADRDVDGAAFLHALVDLAHVDVNAVDHDGSTPLHLAIARRNLTLVRTLVELGANIDQDRNGLSAFHCLCDRHVSNDGSACAQLLLALGIDVGAMSEVCESEHQCQFGQLSAIVRAILAAMDEVNQEDKDAPPAAAAAAAAATVAAAAAAAAAVCGADIDASCRRIAKTRLDLVRHRALQICVALCPLGLDALLLCEVMRHSFGALGSLIAFHQWWAIATKVKHFH